MGIFPACFYHLTIVFSCFGFVTGYVLKVLYAFSGRLHVWKWSPSLSDWNTSFD